MFLPIVLLSKSTRVTRQPTVCFTLVIGPFALTVGVSGKVAIEKTWRMPREKGGCIEENETDTPSSLDVMFAKFDKQPGS